jgi:hypothetical protein
MNKLLKYCQRHFIATGSRVIGGETNLSDWDFVIHKYELLPFLKENNLVINERSRGSLYEMFDSLKFNEKGVEINLIVVQTWDELEIWLNATIMTKKENPPDKMGRKSIFGKHLLSGYNLIKWLNDDFDNKYKKALKMWG